MVVPVGGKRRKSPVVNETFKLQTLCSSHVHHPCYGETARKFCIHKIRQFFCTWVCLFGCLEKSKQEFSQMFAFHGELPRYNPVKNHQLKQTTVKKRYLFTMKLHYLTPNGPPTLSSYFPLYWLVFFGILILVYSNP